MTFFFLTIQKVLFWRFDSVVISASVAFTAFSITYLPLKRMNTYITVDEFYGECLDENKS